jgi:hypothetical protein
MLPELVGEVCAIVGGIITNPFLSNSIVITTPNDNAAVILRHTIKL